MSVALPDSRPGGCPLWDAFDEVARRSPGAAAIVDGPEATSYGALHDLARRVRLPEGEPGAPIGLCLPTGPEWLAALLGIWRHGRLALLLDPLAPAPSARERIAQAAPSVVFCDAEWARTGSELGEAADRLRSLELDGDAVEVHTPPAGPSSRPGPPHENAASLTFTSGTTGHPKGVLHSQSSLLWNARLNLDGLGLTSDDRVASLYPPSVNPLIRDLLSTLLAGATLLPLVPGREVSLATLAEVATVLSSGVSLFRKLAAGAPEPPRGPVRAVRLGGEAVRSPDLAEVARLFPSCRIVYRGLGSTETGTVTQCTTDLAESTPSVGPVDLGFPAPGVRVELSGSSVTEGELLIRSPGVALGYWRQDGSIERLVEPFPTGDVVRRSPDGRLAYLGRADRRHKLSGWRIDVEGLERSLSGLESVRQVAVVPTADDRGSRLRVFVVAASPSESLDEVARSLRGLLPSASIGVEVERLSTLPVTASGKLDRAALAARRPPRRGSYRHPRDPIESRLQALWREVLGVELVGIDHDFFESGGDSLTAAVLTLEIESRFGLSWSPSSLLERSTIARQAADVREAVADAGESPVLWLARAPGRPLFCIPAVDGYAFVFRQLARRLEQTVAVAVLQYPGLDGRRSPASTVEELALALVESVESVQPEGGVRLLGHSHGGLVGFEMARELGRRGRTVESLVLCDAHVPGAFGWRARRMRDLEIAWRAAGESLRESGGRWRGSLVALAEMGRQGLRRRWSKTLIEHRIHRVRTAQLAARGRYRSSGPVPALERVLLLRADPGPNDPHRYLRWVADDNGWSELLGVAPRVEPVPGGHVDILHEPQVETLADHVARWI